MIYTWIFVFLCMSAVSDSYKCGKCQCIARRGLILCTHARLRNYPIVPRSMLFRRLDLRFNLLRSLPPKDIMTQFHHIDLRGNPLNCHQEGLLDNSQITQDACSMIVTASQPPTPVGSTTNTMHIGDSRRIIHPKEVPAATINDLVTSTPSDNPLLMITLSSTGAVTVCVCISVLCGLYFKWRKTNVFTKQPVTIYECIDLSISGSETSTRGAQVVTDDELTISNAVVNVTPMDAEQSPPVREHVVVEVHSPPHDHDSHLPVPSNHHPATLSPPMDTAPDAPHSSPTDTDNSGLHSGLLGRAATALHSPPPDTASPPPTTSKMRRKPPRPAPYRKRTQTPPPPPPRPPTSPTRKRKANLIGKVLKKVKREQ